MGVIDLLEVIHIQQQQRQLVAETMRTGEFSRSQAHEVRAVEAAGQAVLARPLLQLYFHCAPHEGVTHGALDQLGAQAVLGQKIGGAGNQRGFAYGFIIQTLSLIHI